MEVRGKQRGAVPPRAVAIPAVTLQTSRDEPPQPPGCPLFTGAPSAERDRIPAGLGKEAEIGAFQRPRPLPDPRPERAGGKRDRGGNRQLEAMPPKRGEDLEGPSLPVQHRGRLEKERAAETPRIDAPPLERRVDDPFQHGGFRLVPAVPVDRPRP